MDETIIKHMLSSNGIIVKRPIIPFEIPYWMLDENGKPLPEYSFINDLPGWKKTH